MMAFQGADFNFWIKFLQEIQNKSWVGRYTQFTNNENEDWPCLDGSKICAFLWLKTWYRLCGRRILTPTSFTQKHWIWLPAPNLCPEVSYSTTRSPSLEIHWGFPAPKIRLKMIHEDCRQSLSVWVFNWCSG